MMAWDFWAFEITLFADICHDYGALWLSFALKICLFWLRLQQFAFVKSRKGRHSTKNIFCTKFQNLVSILNGSSHFEQVPTKLSFVKRILYTTFKGLIIEKWLTEFASTFTSHPKVATKSPYICHLSPHKRLMQKSLTKRDQAHTCFSALLWSLLSLSCWQTPYLSHLNRYKYGKIVK